MNAEAARILVVEDNDTTARTLAVFLRARGYGVVLAAGGREGLARFEDGGFDLVLLDRMLPDVDGLEVCRRIRQRSEVPVVLLTARTGEDHVVAGLESGADDYVGKPFGSRELLARIRRCLERAGAAPDDGDTVRIGEVVLDVVRRSVTVAGRSVRLTRSEFDLLHVLARNPGRVFTRGQLIERALRSEGGASERTVDTHVWSLRRKLGEPRGRPRIVLSEPGVGYRASDRDAS